VLLHPGSSPDTRLDPHYLANLVGNPVETTVAAAELVFGDVLGAHPGLRLVLVHCGGGVPLLAGRWQRGLDTKRPGVGELSVGPRDAVRRFWVDALAHDPAVVDLAAAVIGEEKLVLGSDWPFPMGLDDPWSAVAHLPADRRDRVARDNALSLRGAAS
jgi:aminocarboxymuconate-semialdehyde decarboxylase